MKLSMRTAAEELALQKGHLRSAEASGKSSTEKLMVSSTSTSQDQGEPAGVVCTPTLSSWSPKAREQLLGPESAEAEGVGAAPQLGPVWSAAPRPGRKELSSTPACALPSRPCLPTPGGIRKKGRGGPGARMTSRVTGDSSNLGVRPPLMRGTFSEGPGKASCQGLRPFGARPALAMVGWGSAP